MWGLTLTLMLTLILTLVLTLILTLVLTLILTHWLFQVQSKTSQSHQPPRTCLPCTVPGAR